MNLRREYSARLRLRGTAEAAVPTGVSSVLAGLLWSQITGLPDAVEVQARRRELGNLPSASGRKLNFKHLAADQTASGAFVHREEVAALPVPAVVGVGSRRYEPSLPVEAGPRSRDDSEEEVGLRD